MIQNSRREKMGKKYLDTKEGSLEQSVLGVWQTAIDEGEARMDGRTKQYKEHRAKLEARRAKSEKLDPVGKEDGDIDNDGDKDSTDKYLAKRRKAISKAIKKDKKEETDLEEGPFSSKSSKAGIGDVAQGVRTIGKKLSPKERDALQKKYGSKAGKKRSSKAYQGKFKEEVEESYEIGTDEYRKHTQDVTPGEDGEWVDAVKNKNESMREALAKVWNTTEDKNPFKKEAKKDLTKEVKDGKTMTGKKIASVDINPIIKEKAK